MKQPASWFPFTVFVFPLPVCDFEERIEDVRRRWSAVPSSRERTWFSGREPVIAEGPGGEQSAAGWSAVGTIRKY